MESLLLYVDSCGHCDFVKIVMETGPIGIFMEVYGFLLIYTNGNHVPLLR